MLLTGFYLFALAQIPDMYYAFEGEDINLDISTFYPITTKINEDDSVPCSSYTMDVKLMGVLPLKEVKVNILPETMLIPGGDTFGVKFYTEGLIVVGLGDIKTSEGDVNPSFDSGIRIRDIILSVNDKKIKNNEDLIDTVLKSKGKSLKVSLLRKDVEFDIDVKPVKDVNDNKYKLGLWVRDSTAGIGTITYINPVTNIFAGLGHGICDVDTGDLMRLLKGNVLKAGINSIRKGEQGVPGELKGVFLESKPIGNLYKNTEEGIFGKTLPNYKHSNKPIPIAFKQDVKEGKAKILCSIDDNGPKEYDIEIVKVYKAVQKSTKNMLIEIVDPVLLEKTGGIVQGMSGSPIIQNGKLVGAVTHVLINEPEKGYGIFIENMLNVE